MSLRNGICFGLVTASLVAACGTPMDPSVPVTPGADEGTRRPQGGTRCPDPTVDCTSTNGQGIYFQEGGWAWVDKDTQLLITRFENAGGGVTFAGRYYHAASGLWLWLNPQGRVLSAQYKGDDYLVDSMKELGGGVAVTLVNPKSNEAFTVSEGDLLGLKLKLAYAYPPDYLPIYVDLTFSAIDKGKGVLVYGLRWSSSKGQGPWSYCFDANGADDTATFLGGIAVDPVNGRVTRDATTETYLTLSCSLGAPTVCQGWGYEHMKFDWYFDSCIHMKRASYCADGEAWTTAGTPILIADDQGLQSDKIDYKKQLEAYWSPKGATCLNNMRHPTLGFSGSCNGAPLPVCPTTASSPFLTSGVP